MRIDHFQLAPPLLLTYTARLGALGFALLATMVFAGIPVAAYTIGANFNVLVLNTTTALPFWLAGIGCALLFEACVSRAFFLCCSVDLQWMLWQPTRADLCAKFSVQSLAVNFIELGGAVLLILLTAYAFSVRKNN